MFAASFYNQDQIGSSKWWQSSVPEPRTGVRSGSSGTPQGRATFCDPSIAVPNYGSCTTDQVNFYDVTLNTGTTTPTWNPANPTTPPSTYHNFGSGDRFNYAPFNLLLTPSQRKSLWTSLTYDASDDVQVYAKGMFNNRTSTNQAAAEPIFVGPYTGSGGIADGINVSRLNPFNPFGIDLCAVAEAPTSSVCPGGPNFVQNFGWITRRPLTPAMLRFIGATQLDSSDQKLKLVSANITGTIFHIQDRAAGIAVGAEHRLYDAAFTPDPLRQTGESQDSLAFPVAASYHVNDAYTEFSFPLLQQ